MLNKYLFIERNGKHISVQPAVQKSSNYVSYLEVTGLRVVSPPDQVAGMLVKENPSAHTLLSCQDGGGVAEESRACWRGDTIPRMSEVTAGMSRPATSRVRSPLVTLMDL